MKVLYTILVVLLVLLIITFSLQNTETVFLRYYDLIQPFPVPAYMLLFIAFLGGVIFTGFLGIIERFRLTRTIHRLNKNIRELRRDLRAQEPPVPEPGSPPETSTT